MARAHGKDTRLYVNATDLSGYASAATPSIGADVHDSTNFGSSGWHESDGGLKMAAIGVETFHDPEAAAEDPILAALVGTDAAVVTAIFDGGDAIGDWGWLIGAASLENYETTANVADLLKKRGQFRGSGSGGRCVLLHVLGAETASVNSNSHDGAASSANGARGNLHVTSEVGGGTWTVKVQHSADDAVWADLITFTNVTAAGAESVAVTGTVNRYLRCSLTKSGGTSITFALAVARL